MQVELEAFEMTHLSLAVVLSEVGFFGAPFFQGFDGDIELLAGQGEIAVELIDLVEGSDFAVQGVSPIHG